MKFRCGYRKHLRDEKRRAKELAELTAAVEWHDFYPIFPVKLEEFDCRCFELVQKRVDLTVWDVAGEHGNWRPATPEEWLGGHWPSKSHKWHFREKKS